LAIHKCQYAELRFILTEGLHPKVQLTKNQISVGAPKGIGRIRRPGQEKTFQIFAQAKILLILVGHAANFVHIKTEKSILNGVKKYQYSSVSDTNSDTDTGLGIRKIARHQKNRLKKPD